MVPAGENVKKRNMLGPVLLLFAFVHVCFGESQTPEDQFLGSPFLALAIIAIIAAVAILYHRFRK
jgi:hypothetical protein